MQKVGTTMKLDAMEVGIPEEGVASIRIAGVFMYITLAELKAITAFVDGETPEVVRGLLKP